MAKRKRSEFMLELADHDVGHVSVGEYSERFYNPTRRHSHLGYVSPIRPSTESGEDQSDSCGACDPTTYGQNLGDDPTDCECDSCDDATTASPQ